jgi:hypothetical protein
MNRDRDCTPNPTADRRTRAEVSASARFSDVGEEPDLFDFCRLNSFNRDGTLFNDRAVDAPFPGSKSPIQQRLSLPQRSFNGDFIPSSSRPTKEKKGQTKFPRLKSPFKMISNRATGGLAEIETLVCSEHAVASISSDSTTTLSSKSMHDLHLFEEKSFLVDQRRCPDVSDLPLESLSISVSDIDDDCISDVSVDYNGFPRPIDVPTTSKHRSCFVEASGYAPTIASDTSDSTLAPCHFHDSETTPSLPSMRNPADGNNRVGAYGDSRLSNSRDPGTVMVEIEPGWFVPLIGTTDTWVAYWSGSVVDQSCMGCNEFLLCSVRSTLVICPVCRIISPVASEIDETSEPTKPFDCLLGLGLTVSLIEERINCQG